MTLHLQNTPHLHEIDLFPIPHTDDLIKRSKQLKTLFLNFTLISCTTHIRNDACEEVEGIDILEDVGGFVSDEEDVEVFEGLIDITDLSGFDGCMLGVCGD